MAHILNLIVQDGLKEIDISLKRIRRAVRWNSTYLMLETVQNFEKGFAKLYLFDDGFSTHLCMHVLRMGMLFYELTEKVSSSRYVTSNCHFEDIYELDSHLKACLATDDTNLSKMAGKMKEKCKKYWGEPEKMHKMIFIASVLDSHNKLEYVGFALEEMFGEEPGKKITVEVDAYLNSLSTSSDSSSGNVRSKSVRTKLQLKRQKEDSGSGCVKSELERYISEEQEPVSDDSDDFKS
ncbi:zinc finger BED domain-containing protein RICESLEEPER 1-like [Nicotiana tomentosiformis]|uniref:zinc finger BED domain-containing protein RICESLEEPER 1-like n=1 Tax=Nicotiana tomentosiformis TaxID=4098 RepID=UPI00388C460F